MKKKQRKRKENFADSQAANLSLEGTSLQALGAQNEELHQDYMVRNKNRHCLLKKEEVSVRMRVACELRESSPNEVHNPSQDECVAAASSVSTPRPFLHKLRGS